MNKMSPGEDRCLQYVTTYMTRIHICIVMEIFVCLINYSCQNYPVYDVMSMVDIDGISETMYIK